MADFPAIVNYAEFVSAAGSNHAITIPTGATGDLLLIGVCLDGAPTLSWPAGYTQLQASVADPDSAVTTAVRYRVTDGSEGATFTLGLGAGSEPIVAHVIRIAKDTFTGTPEAGTAATTATGTPTSTPDPPSLTPSTGSDDYLFWVFGGNDGGNLTLTATQDYRGDYIMTNRTGNVTATDVLAYSILKWVTGTVLDPAALTLTGNQEWVINTFSVQGQAVPAGSGGQRIFGG